MARIERGYLGASLDTVFRIFETLGISLETKTDSNINEQPPLLEWQVTLKNLTKQMREDAAQHGRELGDSEARKAILDAAIAAGDPDRITPPDTKRKPSLEETGRNNHD